MRKHRRQLAAGFRPRRDRFAAGPGLVPPKTVELSELRDFFVCNMFAKSPEYTFVPPGYDALDHYGHYLYFPFVTSPLARRALVHLYEKADTDEYYISYLSDPANQESLKDEIGLWQRLNASGLSIIIAEGGKLPEISDPFNRLFSFMSKPLGASHNLEGQLDELVASLDLRLPDPGYRMFEYRPRYLLLAVSLLLITPYWFRVLTEGTLYNYLIAGLYVVVAVSFSLYYNPPPSRNSNRRTNATLLFHYLLQEYSEDLDEPEVIKEPERPPRGIIVR